MWWSLPDLASQGQSSLAEANHGRGDAGYQAWLLNVCPSVEVSPGKGGGHSFPGLILQGLTRNVQASCGKGGCSLHDLEPQGIASPAEASNGKVGAVIVVWLCRTCPVQQRPFMEEGGTACLYCLLRTFLVLWSPVKEGGHSSPNLASQGLAFVKERALFPQTWLPRACLFLQKPELEEGHTTSPA